MSPEFRKSRKAKPTFSHEVERNVRKLKAANLFGLGHSKKSREVIQLIDDEQKAEAIENYIHLDLRAKTADAPNLRKKGRFHMYYRNEVEDEKAGRMLIQALDECLKVQTMPSMRLQDVQISICKLARTNNKWKAFRLEVIREKKMRSLKEKTCRPCASKPKANEEEIYYVQAKGYILGCMKRLFISNQGLRK